MASQVKDVAVVVGSLRQASFSRKVALALASVAPPSLRLSIVEIRSLGFYNQDLEDTPPTEWTEFRTRLKAAAAVIFVTPEYNGSMPGVLKNAIDIGSRPYGQSAWDAKPAAVVSVTPGALGAFGANHHLRQSLVFLNMPTLQQPEVYIGGASKLFDEAGKLTNDSTRELLQKLLQTFDGWIDANTKR